MLTSGLALANLLSLVVITPVVAFFLLRDWDRIIATVDASMPRDHLGTIREQARQVDAMLGGYMRANCWSACSSTFFTPSPYRSRGSNSA